MPRAPKAPVNRVGRPTDFSEDVLTIVVEQYQRGKSLYQIAEDPTLPCYSTLAKWRHTRPDFFEILKTCDEDRQRVALAEIQALATKVKGVVMGMTPAEMVERPALVKTALAAYDKVSRAPAITGDAPPPLPDDAEVQRKTFHDLHPVTQEAIRKALLEERRLRGDDES